MLLTHHRRYTAAAIISRPAMYRRRYTYLFTVACHIAYRTSSTCAHDTAHGTQISCRFHRGELACYLPARGDMPKSLAQAARLRRRPARPPCCARRRERRRCAQARPHRTRPRARAALARPAQPYTCLTARRPSLTPPPCVCRATALLRRAERAPRAWRRRGAHPLLEVRSVRLLPRAACTTLNLSPPHASAPLPTSCSLARCARRCSRPC